MPWSESVYSTHLQLVFVKTSFVSLNLAFSLDTGEKTVDFSQYSDRHRTSLAHFLNNGKWNSAALGTNLRQSVVETVYQHSRKINQPVLCIIDDTIASKTRPSSQAAHPIEAASNHMSHLKCRMDFGHQAIGVRLACRELLLNYAIILYDKSQGKIELVSSI